MPNCLVVRLMWYRLMVRCRLLVVEKRLRQRARQLHAAADQEVELGAGLVNGGCDSECVSNSAGGSVLLRQRGIGGGKEAATAHATAAVADQEVELGVGLLNGGCDSECDSDSARAGGSDEVRLRICRESEMSARDMFLEIERTLFTVMLKVVDGEMSERRRRLLFARLRQRWEFSEVIVAGAGSEMIVLSGTVATEGAAGNSASVDHMGSHEDEDEVLQDEWTAKLSTAGLQSYMTASSEIVATDGAAMKTEGD